MHLNIGAEYEVTYGHCLHQLKQVVVQSLEGHDKIEAENASDFFEAHKVLLSKIERL
jgi:hypothetical protein